jgi:hypothetical protein
MNFNIVKALVELITAKAVVLDLAMAKLPVLVTKVKTHVVAAVFA